MQVIRPEKINDKSTQLDSLCHFMRLHECETVCITVGSKTDDSKQKPETVYDVVLHGYSQKDIYFQSVNGIPLYYDVTASKNRNIMNDAKYLMEQCHSKLQQIVFDVTKQIESHPRKMVENVFGKSWLDDSYWFKFSDGTSRSLTIEQLSNIGMKVTPEAGSKLYISIDTMISDVITPIILDEHDSDNILGILRPGRYYLIKPVTDNNASDKKE